MTTLTGWRRAGLAVLAGAVGALAQAPVNAFPVLWLSLPVLVLLLDGAAARPTRRAQVMGAAWSGWWFGFGYFFGGLWWIGAAFLVDAAQFAWLIPFAVTALPAGLALFTALGAALAVLLWAPGATRIGALCLGLTAAEWLRGHVLTGFPWNSLGYGLAADDRLMQTASLVGLNGMTILAVLVFAAPAALIGPLGRRRSGTAFAAAAAVVFVGMAVFGALRLGEAPSPDVPGVRLRLVQPAIDQAQKWDPANRWSTFDALLALTRGPWPAALAAPGAWQTTLVVWPETATPFAFETSTIALADAAAAIGPGGLLAAGTVRIDDAEEGEPRYFNNLLVLDHAGTVRGRYDKVHLVPFGEYVPSQRWLGAIGLGSLSNLVGGFTAGAGARMLRLDGLPPFEPLICYEIIFPDEVARGARPGFLLNITNDAWFGETAGPHQHLAQARLRAVEQGLPVVRAANTGISAMIDGLGRVRGALALGARGTLDGRLPTARIATLYARVGDLPNLLICAIILGWTMIVRARHANLILTKRGGTLSLRS